ncbi:MAG: hypothetical protein AB7E65_11720, partial [Syntrophotalea sp.]|uniref:hypothetical protein n=1 Tax=Syntrophotalea sp. TaxID=2812029 RepID=UPI003D0C7F0E
RSAGLGVVISSPPVSPTYSRETGGECPALFYGGGKFAARMLSKMGNAPNYTCQVKYNGGEPADIRNWTIQNLQIIQ